MTDAMDQVDRQKQIMIIAGEVSGDMHGANLVREARKQDSTIRFAGIGGDAMEREGVHILINAAQLAVVGITEAVANAKRLLSGLADAKRFLRTRRPDLLVLIDFPDFNLHVARTARKLGVPVLYYISPQIWAWRRGRVKKIKKLVDHMAVILPFEVPFYEESGVPVTFVGHPLLDQPEPRDDRDVSSRRPGHPVIGLLPGSRNGEIQRHLPVLMSSARILTDRIPDAEFVLSAASTIDQQQVAEDASAIADGMNLLIETGPISRVFSRCTMVIAASGTVTLEAAIAGIPMVVIYKISTLTSWIAKRLLRVDHVCLPNLISDREVVPELLQTDATPETIAKTVEDILTDPSRLDRMRKDLLGLHQLLGGEGASRRVASIALEIIEQGNRKG